MKHLKKDTAGGTVRKRLIYLEEQSTYSIFVGFPDSAMSDQSISIACLLM